MKTAVILAGGRGIRLLPSTEELPKPMIRINNKPIMEYVIALIKKLGFEKIYIIVGYKQELIRNYFSDGNEFGIKIEYIENIFLNDKTRSGLSDAILLLEGMINEQFMVILGDEIYVKTKHKEMLTAFKKDNSCECMFGVIETDDEAVIKKNYSVNVDKHYNVIDLEEKPVKPFNKIAGCGTYLFRPSIFKYIKETTISQKTGRKELADTMKMIIKDNKIVKAFSLEGIYLNINFQEDLLFAQKIINIKEVNL